MGDAPDIHPPPERLIVRILNWSSFASIPVVLLFGSVWSFMLSVQVTSPRDSLSVAVAVTCAWALAALVGWHAVGEKTPHRAVGIIVFLPLFLYPLLLCGPVHAAGVYGQWYPMAVYLGAAAAAAVCFVGIRLMTKRVSLRGVLSSMRVLAALPSAIVRASVSASPQRHAFELRPISSLFSTHYEVQESGVVGRLSRSVSRTTHAEIIVDRASWRARRTGLLKHMFTLESDGSVLAEVAQQRMFNRSRLLLRHRGQSYSLRIAEKVFGADRLIVESDGREVGSLEPDGRAVVGSITHELQLPVRVFLAWIALLLWEGRGSKFGD